MIFNEVSQSTPGFKAFNITTDLKSLVTTDDFKITKTQVFIHTKIGLKIYIDFFLSPIESFDPSSHLYFPTLIFNTLKI